MFLSMGHTRRVQRKRVRRQVQGKAQNVGLRVREMRPGRSGENFQVYTALSRFL